MIAIVNVSTHSDPFGWHDYELRINQTVIASFRHKREEGLTKCLQRAAAAAEKSKWGAMEGIMTSIGVNQFYESPDESDGGTH